MNKSARSVAFLDRDGTINVDHGFVYCIKDWKFTDRAAEAIALLCDAGFRNVVVTNQSGIAAGMYSKTEVETLHAFMRQQLARAGTRIDAIVVCPHARDEHCSCRKPRTGMADQIAARLTQPIDYKSSWTIGDKPSDVGFGVALGTQTALIRSRYWTEGDLEVEPTLIVESLYEAAVRIVGRGG